MKRRYIVQKAPNPEKDRESSFNKEAAVEAARRSASQTRDRYIVCEAIAMFQPVNDVEEVPFDDE